MEVSSMKQQTQVSKQVDEWIHELGLPPRANFKVVRRFDDIYPDDEPEDWQGRYAYRKWFMSNEHRLLLSIAKGRMERDFWEEW